jgi:magnesium-transporting ATPase (P-type)
MEKEKTDLTGNTTVDDRKSDASNDQHEFFYAPKELNFICDLDNRHMDEGCSQYANRTISSGLIVEKHYGVDTIMKNLKSKPKYGISGTKQDIEERQRIFGPNYFPPPHIKSLWELVMENFDDRINQILAIAALISLVIGVL